jgi:hypothetical protein
LSYQSLTRWFATAAWTGDRTEVERVRLALAAAAARSSGYVAGRLAYAANRSSRRDSVVAENIMFVADTLYPAQKIIVWTDNAAARRGSDLGTDRTIAARVDQHRPGYGLFSVGLYASGVRRARPVVARAPASPEPPTLAMLVEGRAGRAAYLDTRTGADDPGGEFLRRRVRDRVDGGSMLVLNTEHDAVITVAWRLAPRVLAPITPAPCCPR